MTGPTSGASRPWWRRWSSRAAPSRSVPARRDCNKHVYDGHKSRNAFEESLLLVLRSMIPQQIKVILLADRGFGRTELARFCQKHGFSYIIRIQPNVHVSCASFKGKLIDYPVHKGIGKLLKSVAYRSHHTVTQNIVIRWVRDLPAKRDECWFLMTDLQAGAAQISQLYRQRMTIEMYHPYCLYCQNFYQVIVRGLGFLNSAA